VFLLDRSPKWPAWRHLGLLLTLVAALGSGTPSLAKDASDELNTVALTALPREAQSTHRLVLSGGPFPYDKDGVVFGNREKQLPAKSRGFYHEYTVKTPGERSRGAQRLVCGGVVPTNPDVCYYTADHYASFKRIVK
jgi:ribonuclease T1